MGDGGTAWPVYAARDGNFKLFPFARSGATCSNNITFRPFPPVFESQLPLFLEETRNGTLRLNPEETIITLWIGTNDVGANALLTGSAPTATVANTTECAVNFVKTMFENGARNFLFQNVRSKSAILEAFRSTSTNPPDDSAATHHSVLVRFVSKQILDCRKKHYHVE